MQQTWNSSDPFWWANGWALMGLTGTSGRDTGHRNTPSTENIILPSAPGSNFRGDEVDGNLVILSNLVDSGAVRLHPCIREDVPVQSTISAQCNVYVFHHLYIDNNWRIILEDQLMKIIFSGLYDRVTAIYSTLSGPNADTLDEAAQLLGKFGSKFQILDKQVNSTQYERLTLHQIRHHVAENDVFLYIHLKGKYLNAAKVLHIVYM